MNCSTRRTASSTVDDRTASMSMTSREWTITRSNLFRISSISGVRLPRPLPLLADHVEPLLLALVAREAPKKPQQAFMKFFRPVQVAGVAGIREDQLTAAS